MGKPDDYQDSKKSRFHHSSSPIRSLPYFNSISSNHFVRMGLYSPFWRKFRAHVIVLLLLGITVFMYLSPNLDDFGSLSAAFNLDSSAPRHDKTAASAAAAAAAAGATVDATNDVDSVAGGSDPTSEDADAEAPLGIVSVDALTSKKSKAGDSKADSGAVSALEGNSLNVDKAKPNPFKKRPGERKDYFGIYGYKPHWTVPSTGPVISQSIFQTWKSNHRTPASFSFTTLNPSYKYRLFDDSEALEYVRRTMPPKVVTAFESLPRPVLKADYFRYIILLEEGGIYSDMDTVCLKPINDWTAGQTGAGMIVGIEADVAERSDWAQWWARSMQIVQWTMASRPGHPILQELVERIADRSEEFLYAGTHLDASARKDPKFDTPVKEGEPLWNVLDWTGPGVWTDVILEYLSTVHNVQVASLQHLAQGKMFGDIFVAPTTGFSPGIGHSGAGEITDKQALVQHLFQGSWKVDDALKRV